MTTPDLSRLTPQALASYHEGMAIVQKKLAACHVPTAAERSAEAVRRGNAEIVRKFGSAVALKTFGVASKRRVDSPKEVLARIDRIAEAVAEKAYKRLTAKPAAKPSASASTSTAQAKYHAGREVKRMGSGYGLFGRTA
jgi:hypothetical protein